MPPDEPESSQAPGHTDPHAPAATDAQAAEPNGSAPLVDQADAATPMRTALLLVAAIGVLYLATSANFLAQPSPHFHFTDMAASWLDGRLDSDTPRRRGGVPGRPDDRPGLQAAIDRATDNGRSGWNDWASYRVLRLAGGEEVRGVFPYKDVPGPRQHEFWTVDGTAMVIDPTRDLAKGCETDRPTAPCDRIVYQVSFPPFPALLVLPFVAVIGYHTPDVLLTLLFALLGPLLLLRWLDRWRQEGLIQFAVAERLWMVALFSLGTVLWYCSIRGTVWFSALAIGVPLHVGYLMAAQGARRPALAGLLLGLGVATRTPLLFAAVFLPLEALFPDGRWLGGEGGRGLKRALAQIAWFALPMAVIGGALAWFNEARWQNPLEFGHFYLLEGTRAPTRDHGLFNFHFLNHNLGAALTNLPKLVSVPPYFLVSRHGLGTLAATPALLLLMACRFPHAPTDAPVVTSDPLASRRRALSRHLGLTVAAIAVPGLLYQNDGWQQFAYRFAVDLWPPLLGVLALHVGRVDRRVKALILISIVIQLFGAITFGRFEQFYYD